MYWFFRLRTGPGKNLILKIENPGLESPGILLKVLESPGILLKVLQCPGILNSEIAKRDCKNDMLLESNSKDKLFGM